MFRRTRALVTFLPLTLVGCGGGEEAEGSASGGNGTLSVPSASAASEPAMPALGGEANVPASEEQGGGGAGGSGGLGELPPATPGVGGMLPVEVDCTAEMDQVFLQDRVIQLDIDFPDGRWQALLTEWDESQTKIYEEVSLRFETELVASAGVRLKGFSSLQNGTGFGGVRAKGTSDPRGKFPLKVDFNRFGGERLHCVDKLNLGNNWADISFMRERLAARMYNAMGVPAARTAYAKVSVDDQFLGIYTVAQQIDKRFLREHFGTENDADDGNLYKSTLTAARDIGTLSWRGDQVSDYALTAGGCPSAFEECGLLLKTNEEDPAKNDYADLIEFLRILNQTPEETFETAIAEVFDVDSFLRLAAVTVAIANPDSYFGLGHNYYLYHRPDTGRWVMLPWDLNEAYAGHPCQDAIDADIDEPVCSASADSYVLARRIFSVPAYKQKYRDYLQETVDTWLTEEQHGAWIAEFDELIGEEIGNDPNYIAELADYNTAISAELSSGAEGKGGHGGPEYNLLDFVLRKRAALLDKLGVQL